jgi:hypothetical protein
MYRGEPTSVSRAVRAAFDRYGTLVAAQLLYFLLAFGILFVTFVSGSVLIYLGGVAAFAGLIVVVAGFAALLFIAARLSLMIQVITLEKSGVGAAFGRSWRLVSGSGWRLLGYLILTVLISTLLSLVLQGLPTVALGLNASVASDVLAGTLINGLASVVIMPLIPLVLTLLYYDLRWSHGEPVPIPGGQSGAVMSPAGHSETNF